MKAGDRVKTRYYGTGTIVSVERPARGMSTYWVRLDDQSIQKNLLKQAGENLTPTEDK